MPIYPAKLLKYAGVEELYPALVSPLMRANRIGKITDGLLYSGDTGHSDQAVESHDTAPEAQTVAIPMPGLHIDDSAPHGGISLGTTAEQSSRQLLLEEPAQQGERPSVYYEDAEFAPNYFTVHSHGQVNTRVTPISALRNFFRSKYPDFD